MSRRSSRRGSSESRSSRRGGSSRKSSGGESQSRRGVFRGAAGRKQAAKEREAIKKRREAAKNRTYGPMRLWMAPDSEREVVVLDEKIDFFRYEHALMNPDTGRNDLYVECVEPEDGCQVCEEKEDRPYFAMYLSVIDLEEYTIKKGDIAAAPGGAVLPHKRMPLPSRIQPLSLYFQNLCHRSAPDSQ